MKKVYLVGLLTGIPAALSGVFIPLLASEFGASYLEIGLIVALFGLANMVSSFVFGRLSDVLGNRKFFVAIGLLASSAAFFMQVFMGSVLSIFIIRSLAAFAIGIFSYPMIAYISRLDKYKTAIGRYSAIGSLGWFLGNVMAAVLLSYFYIFILSGAFFLAAFFVSRELPDNWEAAVVVPRFPLKLIKKNLPLYLSYFLRHMGIQAVFPVLPVYMLSLGADKFWVALLLSINSLLQFFVMNLAGRLDSRRETLMIRAGIISSLLAFSFLPFADSFLWVGLSMAFIAVGWGLLWVGSLTYLIDRNPERSTSTGVMGAFLSLAVVIGPALGGVVTQLWGVNSLFLFSVLCCGLGLGVSTRIRK